MVAIRDRIPLQIIEGRLILTSVIYCRALRIPKQIMDFVIDTGSPNSYLSNKDVKRLQVPIKGIPSEEEVDFGGSRYKQIPLPKVDMHLLKEDKDKNEAIHLMISLYALKTTKSSVRKIQMAQALPSILGLDFLKEQKFSLYVNLIEKVAYLQHEE